MSEPRPRIVLATGNPHKLEELQAIFNACAHGEAGVELVSLAAVAVDVDEPVEDGATFEANAIKKARHYAAATGLPCLADDSGLAVDALAGEPGVRSARYSGASGPRAEVDLANNRLLLDRLGDTPAAERTARFVCVMALAEPGDGGQARATVRGTVEGRILLPAEAADPSQPERGRGANGFGYDPLFFVPDLGRTTAELSPEAKNRISHRGHAARGMYEKLIELGLVSTGDH
ncbi:MAG: non-canonical purine NTP pyrophosphatase [Phycisphaeraceae bacterium]